MRPRTSFVPVTFVVIFFLAFVAGTAFGQYTQTTFAKGMTSIRNGTVLWQGNNITTYVAGTTTNGYVLFGGGYTNIWGTAGAPHDDVSQLVPIGFPFQFYGNVYGEVYVSTNGFITFTNAGTTASANTALPNAGTPNNLIAVFWDDIVIQPNQGIFGDSVGYRVTGAAPNRVFSVRYRGVSRAGNTASEIYGSIDLHEGTNIIELLYYRNFTNWGGMNATAGIENSGGTAGFQVAGSPNLTTFPANNIRYTPTVTGVSIDDVASSAIPLGFAFDFYGNNYTQLYVSSNGFASFTNTAVISSTNADILTNATPNNVMAPFWDDLGVQNQGAMDIVWYSTTGSSPNRVFTLEYHSVTRMGQTTTEVTGQVKLYEGTNRIEVHYPTPAGLNTWVGMTASIGIEDSTGANRSVVTGTPTIAAAPATNFRWDPPPANLLPQAVSVVGTPPVYVSPGGTFQVNRTIQNTGGQVGTSTYSIRLSADTTIDATDTAVYNGSVTVPGWATDTQTDTCTVPGTMALGSYYVGLYIAAGNTTNTTAQDVIVATPFNAVAQTITTVGAPVTVPATGGTFQATRAIQNTGGSPGTANYTLYISTDNVIDATDTQVFTGSTATIAPGGTDTQTDTCTVPAGLIPGTQYYVGLFIAAGNTAVTAQQDVTITGPIF
ncbi:MAG: hypothetical protein ACYTHN_18840, partial [Planctomycetota bacterium]